MNKNLHRIISILLVLALVVSGLPGGFGPVSRAYAAGNAATASSGGGFHQVGCSRTGFDGTYVLMYDGPVLLSRILMGVGLKNKTVTADPSFDPAAGIQAVKEGTDWKISYSGTPDASWTCDMTVVCGSDTYVIHLAKLNDSDQPGSGTWVNKESSPVTMKWVYESGVLTLSPADPSQKGELSKRGESDDFGLDKSAGTNSANNQDWIPEVPWKYWIDDITEVRVEAGVTTIGQQAFRRHRALETVTVISSDLTKIRKDAFNGCSALKTLDLRNCDSLTEIGQNLSEAEGPFYNSGLETILLPPALTALTKSVLHWHGSQLKQVNLSDLVNLVSIEEEALKKEDTSPAIADSAVAGGLNLDRQPALETIGKNAFRNQTGLNTALVIASPVLQTIGDGAFSSWDNKHGLLASVDLSACAALQTIGKEAFLYQVNLESVRFPDAFTWIHKDAFKNCTKLGLSAASIAYCVGGNGALYKVNADGSAAKVLNDGDATLYWIPTAIGSDPLAYNGAEQELVNAPSLRPETGSYTISYTLDGSPVSGVPKAKDPGTYTVAYAVTLPDGTTNQSGSITVTIEAASLTDEMLKLDKASFEYTGETQAPALTVEFGGTVLQKDTDYTVAAGSETSAKDVGTYTITVEGMGGYAGTATTGWSIKDETAPVISDVTDGATYGVPVSFTVTDLRLDTVTLEKASGATQSLPVSGGSASGSVSENGTYTIAATDLSGNAAALTFTVDIKKALADPMLTLDEDLFEYNGAVRTPVLTVKDGETVLEKDTDYTVAAGSETDAKDVGTYTITVDGIGAYTSSAAISWSIADTTKPEVAGVEDGTEYAADVNFTVSDLLLETVTLEKDSGAAQTLAVSGGTASGSASEDGVYTLTAKDTSGNVTTVTFTINVPVPVVTQAETPVFDPAGGTQFRGRLEVRISCATPGAVIRYTTDGTDPDETNGTVYTSGSAVTLTRSTVLKAFATADGYTGSEIASASYTRRSTRRTQDEEIPDDGPPLVTIFPFVDVPEDVYYRKAVEWALENGVTAGTTPTTFSPALDATRAQTVTFLWAAAGAPEPETADSPFKDVSAEDYYCKAVLWAYENGITAGVSADEFAPDRPVTRGQVVTFLWAAAGAPEPGAADCPFEDVAETDYCYKAVLWAYGKGITVGTGETAFGPDAACLREQIVTFLYLFYGE